MDDWLVAKELERLTDLKVGRGPEGEFTPGARTGGEPTGRNPSVGRAAHGLQAFIATNDYVNEPLTRERFEEMVEAAARSFGFEYSADGVDPEAEDQDQDPGDDRQHQVLEGEVHDS